MIGEALWARTEEHRQLAAMRERLVRDEITLHADETRGDGGRPGGAPTAPGRSFSDIAR
jgi:hypothetical protein